jgi:EAL domain-containing protein (putative c-di-GMP-specific phosphodiesterase class I)
MAEHPNHLVQETEPFVGGDVLWLIGRTDSSSALLQVPISSFPFQIGRKSGLSIAISSPTVSSLHAEVVQRGGELYLRDLESTNGTYANGVRIKDDVKISEGDLLQFSSVTLRVSKRPDDLTSGTVQHDACDQAIALCQFDKLINQRAAIPFFQPIINMHTSDLAGYEILGRSRLFGLRTPQEMFMVAAQLNQAAELSRVFRFQGIQQAQLLPGLPNIFVNTHPVELLESGMLDSLRAVRLLNPHQPITLEIHEAAVADTKTMRDLQAALQELQIELAYDDFGSGQARLVELIEVCPNYIKFDRQLVHDIHRASGPRQQMLATLVRLVRELGVVPLAEGIEAAEDYATCRELGFELAQGFYIGRPASVKYYLAPPEERTEKAKTIAERLVEGEVSVDELASLSDSLPTPPEALSAFIMSMNHQESQGP